MYPFLPDTPRCPRCDSIADVKRKGLVPQGSRRVMDLTGCILLYGVRFLCKKCE